MQIKADVQIRSILDLADRMIVVSEKGFLSCDDDGCLLLNGMVRDSAYRIRDAAERERDSHLTQGKRQPAKQKGPSRRVAVVKRKRTVEKAKAR
jgi:hypothetical protein